METVQVELMDIISEITIGDSCEKQQEEICRICSKKSDSFIPIFENDNLFVAEKISRCLPIVLLSTDKLPQNICTHCFHCLNISYKLIITSVKTDVFLREQFLSQETECVSVDEVLKSIDLTEKSETKNDSENISIQNLLEKAITGPIECQLCDINFSDMNVFDNHMETVHFLSWKCNLCDSSFELSSDLISHKNIQHNGDSITICESCENKKDDINQTVVKQEPIELHCVRESLDEKRNIDCEKEKIFSIKDKNIKQKLSMIDNDAIFFQNKLNDILQSKNQNTPKRLFLPKTKKKERRLLLLCDICKIGFGDDKHFNAHNAIHEQKQMTCNTCSTNCSSIYNLFLHKREEHNKYKKVQLKYVCDKCGKFFTNSWQWESHKCSTCSMKYPNNCCKYCNTTFSTNLKLTRHLRKHKNEMLNDPDVTVYRCVACPKTFVDKEFYQKHRNVHDPECWDKYRCTQCNRSFRDSVRLKEHQLSIHENIKPHQCDICNRKFHRQSNMKAHRAIHFGHKCGKCESVFKKLRDLFNHMKQEHNIEPDKKNFSHNNNSYVCRYCGKKLATYQSVVNHEYIHTGEKPYSCSVCHKTFRSYTSRWAHMQRHKKGTFVCEHCGKCFSYKQNLMVHIKTHAPVEERKYQCSKCGKRFVRKYQLNVHARIHDGIRPYTCDICLFSFTQLGDMKRHRIRHMNGEVRLRNTKNRATQILKNQTTAEIQ